MDHSFSDTAVVACGTMRPEIEQLDRFKTLLTDQLTVLKENRVSV